MTDPGQPLARVTLIDNQLELVINEMRDGNRYLLVYASQGMTRIGHPELVFVIQHPAGQQATPERFPGLMARLIFEEAGAGRLRPMIGTTLEIPEPARVMDRDGRISGYAYVKAPDNLRSSARFDRPPLLLVPLVDDEGAVAHYFGAARVLALLSEQTRRYPFPWWYEPGRPAVVHQPEYGSSTMLAKAALLHMTTSQVVYAGDRVDLWIPTDQVGYLHQMLRQAPTASIALLPGLATVAKNYTWRPGQTGRHATVIPGREADLAIGCNHLLIVRGQTTHDYAEVLEDGILLMLTLPGYDRLVAAVAGMGPAEFSLVQGVARVFSVRRL